MCATERHDVCNGPSWAGHGAGADVLLAPGRAPSPALETDLVAGNRTEPDARGRPCRPEPAGTGTAPDRPTLATTSTLVAPAVAASPLKVVRLPSPYPASARFHDPAAR